MKKRIICIILAFALLSELCGTGTFSVSAASRVPVTNQSGATGSDILAQARKWANVGATYWSASTPWPDCIAWRTGFTLNGQTSFDCSGFVSRVLNDAGFRGESIVANYACILRDTYGPYFIGTTIAEQMNYGTDITDAVLKAKNGDYSELIPGDIIGWQGDATLGSHVIIYAGMNSSGQPTMIEFTGSGYLERVVTASYQRAFQNGSRFVDETPSSTDYLKSCTYYPSYVSIKTPSASKLWNIPCSDSTSDDAVNIAKTSAGETLTATALYLNTAGNYWYRVSYNGTTCYLYGGNTTYQTAYYSDVAISNVVAPSRITQGSTFAIGGTITSTYNYINYIEANVYSNATDDRVLSSSVTVNTRSYSLRSSTIDNELTFNTLGAGSYAYDINARVRNYYTPDGDALQSEYLWIDLYSTDFTVASQNPTPTTYTVTYNANGGSCSVGSKTVAAGAAVGELPYPTRYGYVFEGWYTSASGGTQVSELTTISGNTTFYAHWSNNYEDLGDNFLAILGHPNSGLALVNNAGNVELGAYGSSESIWRFKRYDEGCYCVLNTTDGNAMDVYNDDKADGTNIWTFPQNDTDAQKWFICETGSGYVLISKSSGKAVDVTGAGTASGTNVQMYTRNASVAQEFSIVKSHRVTYHANGGSGAPASQTKYVGTHLTLSGTIPTRFGYSFRGWATSSSASSAAYMPGNSYSNEADVTLYAVWAAAEELSGSTYGQFQRNTSVSCPDAGVYYAFIPNANTVYRITSSADQDTRMYLYDADGNLLASDDDSGENLNFLLTYDFTANETYYIYVRFYGSATTGTIPITISKRYSITYDANGGTGAPAAQYHFFDEAITLSTEEPTRSGHVFQGWGRSSASESATYFPGDECAINMNLSLYAVWDSNSYTVHYDANGGSGAPDAQEKTAGTDLTLSAVVPTRFGYKFLGWATSSSASSPAYLPGASYRTEADVTLYALWQSAGSISNGVLMAEKRADIIFADQCEYYRFTPNFNGKVQFESTGYCDSQIYLYGADGTQLEWNDDGGGNRNFLLTCTVTSGTNYYVKVKHYGSGTGTIIFTAKRAYDVTYDANGGADVPSAQLKVYDTDLTLSTTEPTRSGYIFQGWADSSDASSAQYQPGNIYSGNANLTLFAVWQEENRQIASGSCGDNLKWGLSEDGVLTISGSGAMTDFSSFGSPWFDCKTRISSIVIEQGVTSIGDYAFNYCENVTSVQIPDSVTVIGRSAFDDCSSLPELILPDGLISIGSHAFYDCTSLSSITIPASVTTIENHAFWDCLSLQQIVVDSGNEVYSSQNGVLYNKQGSVLITYPAGKEGEFHIPETVTTISGFAFYNASKMSAVTIPNYVTSIGDSAFRGCKGLHTVEIPESISTIPQYMFCSCESLSRITIPTNITLIEYDAFAYCDNLTQITFVGDAPEFAEKVFLNVTADAYYPARNSTWTADVMQDYGGTITWCKNDAAQIASGYSGALTWSLNGDGVLTFSGEGKMKNYSHKTEMPWYSYASQIISVVLEEGVTSIGDYAFYGMPSLLTISIPESVTTIGNYAFKNCPVLDGVMLPSQLNKLGESAFYACTGLRMIEIPVSLWTVQPYTFKNCTALETILFNEGNLMKISDGAFYNTAVTELELPDCLTILDVYSFKNCARLTSVELGTGLTELREAVFYSSAIPTIEIPEGITKIGPYAFKNCVKLETVDLPETLTSVGEASFYACTALESLELPDAVTKIGNYAFRKCADLRRVTFSDSLVNIGESSFYGCESLFYLEIPGNVITIQGYAFKGCTNLGIVELPDSLKTLGDSAFHTCTGLDEITIPGSVTKVGEYCFSGSTGINDIYFLGNAPTIGSGAFNKLTATAYYPSGNATWTAAVRQNYGGSITWTAQ